MLLFPFVVCLSALPCHDLPRCVVSLLPAAFVVPVPTAAVAALPTAPSFQRGICDCLALQHVPQVSGVYVVFLP